MNRSPRHSNTIPGKLWRRRPNGVLTEVCVREQCTGSQNCCGPIVRSANHSDAHHVHADGTSMANARQGHGSPGRAPRQLQMVEPTGVDATAKQHEPPGMGKTRKGLNVVCIGIATDIELVSPFTADANPLGTTSAKTMRMPSPDRSGKALKAFEASTPPKQVAHQITTIACSAARPEKEKAPVDFSAGGPVGQREE